MKAWRMRYPVTTFLMLLLLLLAVLGPLAGWLSISVLMVIFVVGFIATITFFVETARPR